MHERDGGDERKQEANAALSNWAGRASGEVLVDLDSNRPTDSELKQIFAVGEISELALLAAALGFKVIIV
jgi:hypothetical protein